MPPTDTFKPLSATSDAPENRRDFRVLLAERPERAKPFRALAESAPPAASPAVHANSACEPQVSLLRDGERITAIRVQCSCGQSVDLACVYGPETVAAPAG